MTLQTDPYILRCPSGSLNCSGRPLLMGILNVTPDSFSDGGQFVSLERATAHAGRMIREGADIIDIGGESSRPGAIPVSESEELDRVLPVIEAIRCESSIPLSIDTYKSSVARAAVDAGADIVNDISGFAADPDMVDFVAERGVPVVLMHMKGMPRNMQSNPVYQDLIGDICLFLEKALLRGEKSGIPRSQMIVDPGIGFGKTRPDNFVILRRLQEFLKLGCPLLLGASRKSFIGWALDLPESERLPGSLAAATAGVLAGAHILRVHDVKETLQAVEIAWRIRDAV